MRAAWGTTGRVLREHWFALAAWWLLGEAVHLGFLHLAAYAGSAWTLGGLLVLPLAVLGRLVAFVAMFLTVRRSMPTLQRLEPVPSTSRDRVDEFFESLLVAVLPFLVFYTAWGSMEEDRNAFARIGADWLVRNHAFDVDFSMEDRAGVVALGPAPVIVLLVALAVRLLSTRFARRLPVWTAPITVYAEAVWTFLVITFVAQQVEQWASGRVAAAWVVDVGDRVAAAVPWLASAWEGAGGLFGLLWTVVFVPLMWITVAGVVYGEVLERRLPNRPVSGGRLRRVATSAFRRLDDFWDAVAFLFRAGPALVGAYLLVSAVWTFLDKALLWGGYRLAAPQEQLFWAVFAGLFVLAVGAVTQPVRIALVATVYDVALARIASRADVEGDPGHGVRGEIADLQAERSADVVGHDEHGPDRVRG